MIDEKTKNKLLKELEKTGNVQISCLKVGIDRSTFYRWRQSNKAFKRVADEKLRYGREANSDIAEQALMLSVKDKNLSAIKYVLSHNSPRYKPQLRKVTIHHSKDVGEQYDLRAKKMIDEASSYLKKSLETVEWVTREQDEWEQKKKEMSARE